MNLSLRNTLPIMPLLRQWRRQLRDMMRGETAEIFFDLTSADEVNAELTAHGVDPLVIDDRDTEANPPRFILANLVCNRAVRSHYPTALTDGPEGSFVEFLKYDLSREAAAQIDECFRQPPGEPTKRVLEVRTDLRAKYPFARTPRQRRQFLAWLLVHGRRELGITPEGALWALIEWDESPDRGLIPSYLTNPAWQAAVPDALEKRSWPKLLRHLRNSESIDSRWLGRARWRPTQPAATRHGVNVLGHYRYASGLQEACVGVVSALERQGFTIARRDLPVNFPCDWRDRERYQSLEVFDTTIYVAAVNTFPKEYFRRSGLHMQSDVKRIAVWYWEVDRLPEEWRKELNWANEVWAPTQFLAETYRKYISVPVVPMLPGVSLPAFARKPRSHFTLPDDRFLVMFSFDMGSVMERKNPLGLIEAFRRAFRADDRAHLCIKVSRGDCAPENLAKLKDACRNASATLIDKVLVREDALALLAAADCYASLHRAEGFGLGLAESMLLGTPVLGTAYSGNLDFMTPANSFLVNAKQAPIDNVPPYPPGSTWAEPDLDQAAELLRFIVRQRDEAKAIAERGRRGVEDLLSVEAAGRRMAARLAESAR